MTYIPNIYTFYSKKIKHICINILLFYYSKWTTINLFLEINKLKLDKLKDNIQKAGVKPQKQQLALRSSPIKENSLCQKWNDTRRAAWRH